MTPSFLVWKGIAHYWQKLRTEWNVDMPSCFWMWPQWEFTTLLQLVSFIKVVFPGRGRRIFGIALNCKPSDNMCIWEWNESSLDVSASRKGQKCQWTWLLHRFQLWAIMFFLLPAKDIIKELVIIITSVLSNEGVRAWVARKQFFCSRGDIQRKKKRYDFSSSSSSKTSWSSSDRAEMRRGTKRALQDVFNYARTWQHYQINERNSLIIPRMTPFDITS